MKYIVVLIDGMADELIPELGNLSPLEYARIDHMHDLAKVSDLGLVQTVPEGMPPGSDVANLSIMGYAPNLYHSGRSPLEAANLGIEMSRDDIIFRCNLVTVSEETDFMDRVMIDHSSSDITSEEAAVLIKDLKVALSPGQQFYPGTSYRNILVWKKGHMNLNLTPPHDFLGQRLEAYLPSEEWILQLQKKSYELLNNHPINVDRRDRGLNPANMVWIWGEGKKPSLDSFKDLYGLDGVTISAVDLIKGIGKCAGMPAIEVEGATGTIETNFTGKAKACLEALKTYDFVYLHLEATDECSHQGQLYEKIRAIELIDEKVIRYLLDEMSEKNIDYKMMILPDHPTPVRIRTHTSEPVPFMIYDSKNVKKSGLDKYCERTCQSTGLSFSQGPDLMSYFIKSINN